MDLSGGQRAAGQHWLLFPDVLYVLCWAIVGLHGFLVGMLPSLPGCHPQLLAPCPLQSSHLSPLPDVQVKFDSFLLLSFTFHYSLFEINKKKIKKPNRINFSTFLACERSRNEPLSSFFHEVTVRLGSAFIPVVQ